MSLELCTLPIRLRANLQLPLRIPQISVRSLGVIYPIAIGYWKSYWTDAIVFTHNHDSKWSNTFLYANRESGILIFSELARSAVVRAKIFYRILN